MAEHALCTCGHSRKRHFVQGKTTRGPCAQCRCAHFVKVKPKKRAKTG